jgi:hypothetical protein
VTALESVVPSATATSCLALKTAWPYAATGVYWIDPDGPGGSSPFPAYCDMDTDGGGWTRCLRQTLTSSNRQSTGRNLLDVRNDAPLPPLSWLAAQCDVTSSTAFLIRGERASQVAFLAVGTAEAGWLADTSGFTCHTVVDRANNNTSRNLQISRQGTFPGSCGVSGSSSRSFWLDRPSPLPESAHLEYTTHGVDHYRRIGTTNNDDTGSKFFEIYLRD